MTVGIEQADGEGLRGDMQVGEAEGRQGKGLVMLAIDVEPRSAAACDHKTGRVSVDLQMLHQMVMSAEIEGHAMLGEKRSPLADEGFAVAMGAIGKEGMMRGDDGPGRSRGSGELRGEETVLSRLISLGKKGVVTV